MKEGREREINGKTERHNLTVKYKGVREDKKITEMKVKREGRFASKKRVIMNKQ